MPWIYARSDLGPFAKLQGVPSQVDVELFVFLILNGKEKD